jgi:hypothetical protein
LRLLKREVFTGVLVQGVALVDLQPLVNLEREDKNMPIVTKMILELSGVNLLLSRLSTLCARIISLRYHQYPSVLQAKNMVSRGQVPQERHLRLGLKLLHLPVAQQELNGVSLGNLLLLLGGLLLQTFLPRYSHSTQLNLLIRLGIVVLRERILMTFLGLSILVRLNDLIPLRGQETTLTPLRGQEMILNVLGLSILVRLSDLILIPVRGMI